MIADRRAFLRQLAALPLIGGSVALIGQPTAVAERPSLLLLRQYANFLFYERRILCHELAAEDIGEARRLERITYDILVNPEFHFPLEREHRVVPKPSTRAALVMSAIGYDWRGG